MEKNYIKNSNNKMFFMKKKFQQQNCENIYLTDFA